MQLLTNDKELNNIAGKIMEEKQDEKNGLVSKETIRSFLERNAKELGLPLSDGDETVTLLYDDVFADVARDEFGAKSDKDDLVKLMKHILQKFVEQLESSPVFQDFA